MAEVRLADVIIPEVYEDYQVENSPENTAFFESGVVVRNGLLDARAGDGGPITHLPFWKDLDRTTEPNLSSDDPAVNAVPEKIGTGMQIARNLYLNNGWSAVDLAGELAGSDPMRRIAARTGNWWNVQWEKRLINAALGVMADNVANYAGDMVADVSIQDGNNAAQANLFTRQAFTSSVYTMGDRFDDTSAIAVHSMIHKRMVDNDDIDYIRDSVGNILMQSYLGRRVIVDDDLPVTPGGVSGFQYTSVLFGNGAFGYGMGSPYKPVAIEREEAAANGGGLETLWERKTWLLHPFGFEFTSATVGADSPSLAEYSDAANWNRVVERKNVPMAFLITNG